MANLKRVSTRDFLRNINAMTEPCQVYSHSELKGTWYPRSATFVTTDFKVAAGTIQALREAITAADMTITSSRARPVRRTVRADAEITPEAAGSFGGPRPAPKPASRRKKVH